MTSHLDREHLELAYSLPFFGPFLEPFLLAFATPLSGTTSRLPWPWTDARAVRSCVDAAWDMLGRWQARRGVVVNLVNFRRAAPLPIMALAATLNRRRVTCMADLLALPPEPYAEVVTAIHQAVYCISLIKPTKIVQPVFGSKVLHHFFPSVVPVFDAAKVAHGVMRLPDFALFRHHGGQPWVLWQNEAEARGPRMLEFHLYFAFCVAQIDAAGPARLASVRRRLGRAWRPFAPPALARNKNSLLWKLDAKAAEFALKGRAVAEGILS
ncbi:MAG: hypothetical protein HYZ53_20890 [Planctomycetes bacterium]|nr:hypothetical protein [Planctomycetota bacterium]